MGTCTMRFRRVLPAAETRCRSPESVIGAMRHMLEGGLQDGNATTLRGTGWSPVVDRLRRQRGCISALVPLIAAAALGCTPKPTPTAALAPAAPVSRADACRVQLEALTSAGSYFARPL